MSRAETPSTAIPGVTLNPAGLPDDLLAQLPQRLAWGAVAAAVLFCVFLGAEPFRPAAAAGHLAPPIVSLLGLLLSVTVAVVARSQRLSLANTLDLAMVFQVGVGIAVWVHELAAPFAETTHTPGVPTAAAWMLFFPAVVPLPLRQAVVGNLLISFAGPLVLVGFIAGGQAPPDFAHVSIWFVGTFVAGGMSAVTSTILQRAFLGLRRARERDGYVLLEPLAQGGMGRVHVARHQRLSRLAAIKTIHPDTALGVSRAEAEHLEQRFALEARITASLRSPHTVELYDHGITEDGRLFYAMELLDGVDLQELVDRFGPLPPSRVVHLLLQACDSLAEAHARGLVHRDIKPSNLMVCRMGFQVDFVKVLDFGTVKRLGDPEEGPLTHAGQYLGTPAYAAPEASLGQVEPRSDLYALACVGWWLLTGTTVFDDPDPHAQLSLHREAPVPALVDATPLAVPQSLEAVLRRCLAKRVSERPADARELARQLRASGVAEWTPEQAERWWSEHLGDAAPRRHAAALPTVGFDEP